MNAFGTFDATVETLAGICRLYDRPRILDVGCGEGAHLLALAPEISGGVGIDVSRRAAATASLRGRETGHLSFRALEAEHLPESGLGRFDIVLFIGSLEHMADPRVALRAARSRMHAGSRIVVVAIASGAPLAAISRLALRWSAMPVIGHLGVEGVRRMAAGVQLDVVEVRPLYRGSGNSPAARTAGGLLSLYDRIGGPTQAVVMMAKDEPAKEALSPAADEARVRAAAAPRGRSRSARPPRRRSK